MEEACSFYTSCVLQFLWWVGRKWIITNGLSSITIKVVNGQFIPEYIRILFAFFFIYKISCYNFLNNMYITHIPNLFISLLCPAIYWFIIMFLHFKHNYEDLSRLVFFLSGHSVSVWSTVREQVLNKTRKESSIF